MKPIILLFKTVLSLLLLVSTFAYAATQKEKITLFDSNIIVNKDTSIDITETITVYANQEKIIHGLVRWLPTKYFDSYGISHNTSYQIKQILVNNQAAPYYTENYYDKLAIYIGDKDTTIPSGFYTYTIQYRVNAAITFLKNQDDLYWNITGHDWPIPILKAKAIIQLPENANLINYIGYTGKTGSREHDISLQLLAKNKISIVSNAPILRGTGLTIAVSWPKGIVHKPIFANPLKLDFSIDKAKYIIFELLLLLLVYFLYAWYFYGRDLRKGTIIPLFEPPHHLSPAAIRFISRMRFDMQAFTAAIISMATKGFMTIQNQGDDFTLIKKANDVNMLTSEERITAHLLFDTSSSLSLSADNSSKIRDAKNALKSSLQTQFKNLYFITNSIYLLPGLFISAFAFVVAILTATDSGKAFFAILWLSMWTVACAVLLSIAANETKLAVKYANVTNIRRALGSTLFATPFLAGEIIGIILFIISGAVSALTMILLFTIAVLNVIFYQLLKVPTDEGRKLMDQIDGFKLFLSSTKGLDKLTSTEMTAELFEKYLPYALALDVENEWGAKFKNALEQGKMDTTSYQPSWYTGTAWRIGNTAGFISHLNSSMTFSISSSSSAKSGSGSSGGNGGVEVGNFPTKH